MKSEPNLNLKLQIYHQLKEKRAINNMLHIKVQKSYSLHKMKEQLLSLQSTQPTTDRSKSAVRRNRFQTPPLTERLIESTVTSPNRQRSLKKQLQIKSENVSPISKICPFSTQTPLQKYFNRYPISDQERVIFQNFIYNKWISAVIAKKSIHVNVPMMSNEERQQKMKKLENLKDFKQARFLRMGNHKQSRQERILIKIKIFTRLAKQLKCTVSNVLSLIKEQKVLYFFTKFRSEDFVTCDQVLRQDIRLVDVPDYQGDRALHISVRRNNVKQMKYVLSKHPDLEAKNYQDQSALQLAINLNKHDCQKELLLAGACPFFVEKPNNLIRIAVFYHIRIICVSENKVESESFEFFRKRIYDEMKYSLNVYQN